MFNNDIDLQIKVGTCWQIVTFVSIFSNTCLQIKFPHHLLWEALAPACLGQLLMRSVCLYVLDTAIQTLLHVSKAQINKVDTQPDE